MNADTQSDLRICDIANANKAAARLRRHGNSSWISRSIFALSLIGLVPGVAIAQTAAPPAADVPNTQEPENREEIVVTGVPPAENIMPTQHSSSSIYGLDLNVMDT